MHIVRYTANNKIQYGVMKDGKVAGYNGSPFDETGKFEPDGSMLNLDEVKLLTPCMPSKVVCLGLNYKKHVEELGFEMPKMPLLFLKPTTAVIGPEDAIEMPPEPRRVDYEGELGIVIGKKAKDVSAADADKYILGYTCVNDVSERNAQNGDGQWTRGKGYDTFAPIGPGIETEINAGNLKLETVLNGEIKQSGNTNDLVFGIAELVEFITKVMTLLPGDVIATGTPSGIGPMNAGDTIEIKIEGIGTLKNYLKEKN